ncbi:hypothetical protein D3C85_1178040 [compost metagenome]
MQGVVEVHEVRAAHGRAAFVVMVIVQLDAGEGIELGAGVLPVLVEPICRQPVLVPAVHGPDLPHAGARVVARHVVHRQVEPPRPVHLRGFLLRSPGFGLLVLGRHPVRDGVGKDGKRARQEHCEQQPGKPEPDPRVEPGHGQAETGFQGEPLVLGIARRRANAFLLRIVPILI